MKVAYFLTISFGVVMLVESLSCGAWKAVPFAIMAIVFPAMYLIQERAR